MVQESGKGDGRDSSRKAGGSFPGLDDDADGAGEAADNEGFHSGPEIAEDPAAAGDGSPAGGPEDPAEEDQSPVGEQDPEQNPPRPRTWN